MQRAKIEKYRRIEKTKCQNDKILIIFLANVTAYVNPLSILVVLCFTEDYLLLEWEMKKNN